MGSLKTQSYATSCLQLMGKIGEKERTLLWENYCGGLSVFTSLGGLGEGGAKCGPRHYKIFRSSSDLRSLSVGYTSSLFAGFSLAFYCSEAPARAGALCTVHDAQTGRYTSC